MVEKHHSFRARWVLGALVAFRRERERQELLAYHPHSSQHLYWKHLQLLLRQPAPVAEYVEPTPTYAHAAPVVKVRDSSTYRCLRGSSVRSSEDVLAFLTQKGNTTVLTGKGFAIGSAGMVNFALFGTVSVPPACCLAMMPYELVALTIKSVEKAADVLVKECMQRFPKIIPHHP